MGRIGCRTWLPLAGWLSTWGACGQSERASQVCSDGSVRFARSDPLELLLRGLVPLPSGGCEPL